MGRQELTVDQRGGLLLEGAAAVVTGADLRGQPQSSRAGAAGTGQGGWPESCLRWGPLGGESLLGTGRALAWASASGSGTAPNSNLPLTLDWALGLRLSPDFPEDRCGAPRGCGGALS